MSEATVVDYSAAMEKEAVITSETPEITHTEIRRHLVDPDRRVWVDIKDIVAVAGVQYSRSGYTIDGVVSSNVLDQHFILDKPKPSDVPAVLCGNCLHAHFTLRFGWYEVLARCVCCGNEAVVYGG